MVRLGGEEVAEELFGLHLHAHAKRQAAEVIGDLGLVGQQGQGRFVAGDGAGEVARPFPGDGQQIPGKAIPLVLFQGLDGQAAACLVVFSLQGGHRPVEQGLHGQGLQFADGGVQPSQGVLGPGRSHGVGRAAR